MWKRERAKERKSEIEIKITIELEKSEILRSTFIHTRCNREGKDETAFTANNDDAI